MIYPTGRAVLLAAAGAPAALVIGVLLPGFWYIGLGWPVFVFALTAIDAVTGAWPREPQAGLAIANTAFVGADISATVRQSFPRAAPRAVDAIVELSPLIDAPAAHRG